MSPERAAAPRRSRLRRVVRRLRDRGGRAGRDVEADGTTAAQRATDDGRWEEARRAWSAVLAAATGDRATALTRLAQAHRQLGDLDEAEAVLARATEEFPTHVGLLSQHAAVASAAGDWPVAVSRWERVLATEPTPRPRAFAQLARAQVQAGDLEAAERTLQRGAAIHDGDLDLRARLAQLANVRRDWPEVVRRWTAVLDDAGADAPTKAYTQLARAHQAQGDIAAAEAVLARGREARPDDLDVAIRWARLATVARDWRTAYERYTVVTRLPGGAPPEVHRDRSRAAAECGEEDLADTALADGLAAHPTDPVLLVERALSAVTRSAWDRFDAAWEEAQANARPPVPPSLYVEVARRCAAAFEHGRADACIAAARQRHPEDRDVQRQYVRNALSVQRLTRPPAEWDWTAALERAREVASQLFAAGAGGDDHLELATELAEASAVDEAVAVLDEALAVHDDDGLREELALLTAARGRWDEAAEHLERLARRADAPLALRSALVRAHLGREDPAAARAAVGEPSAAGADEPQLLAELARTATARGDHDAAVAHWRRVTELAPASLDARRRLAIALRATGDHAGERAAIATARGAGLDLEALPGTVAIVGGGPSLQGVDLTPLRAQVHTVAVNATATALPWADVAVSHDPSHLVERFEGYDGPVIAGLPAAALRTWGRLPGFELRRRLVTGRLSDLDPVLHSGGHTSAYTALNYAYLLGARRIVLFGIDLTALPKPDDYWHDAQDRFNRQRLDDLASRPTFERWWEYRERKLRGAPAVFATALPQLERAGCEVINASPPSTLTCFPKVTPLEGVAACLAGWS